MMLYWSQGSGRHGPVRTQAHRGDASCADRATYNRLVSASTLTSLFGTALPLIQAPMAGAQGSALAIAVSSAGGLGSLPAAMLTPDGLRDEIAATTAATSKPYNVNFFCHVPPTPDADRELRWRERLAPYYRELDIDPQTIPSGP